MNYKFFLQTVAKVVLFSLPLSITSCQIPEPEPEREGVPFIHSFRFSIKNETTSDLNVKLMVGEIPSPNARFGEFSLFPDEVYQLSGNELWSAELGTNSKIRPENHDSVFNLIPFDGLGNPIDENSDPIILLVWEKLREKLLDRFISFVLTISQGDEIVFRAVGWDIPDEDMKTFSIDDKMWGFYHTAEENFTGHCGQIMMFPFLTSRFFPDEIGGRGFIGSLTYYVRVTPTGTYMEKMDTVSHNLDDQIWRELERR